MRWLIGGLVGGAIVLGLLIGAYAIGYDRGKHHGQTAASPAKPATSAPAAPQAGGAKPLTGAALVAEGKRLFTADACSACHSLDGSAGVGPTLKGVAGSSVTLADGSTQAADDAYLAESLTNPDAKIVKGYQKGVMSAAVGSFHLESGSADVNALVAFIKAQR